MARPDRFDEDEEGYERGRPPRPSTPPVLRIALVLGGMLVLSVAACGALGFFWTRAAVQEERAVQAEAEAEVAAGKAAKGTQRVHTRQEFRDLVTGKTPDEVIAAVGKPDDTREEGDLTRWTYGGRVQDPGPGQPAADPVVVFRAGKAAEVQY
jgi:hypothetical protein